MSKVTPVSSIVWIFRTYQRTSQNLCLMANIHAWTFPDAIFQPGE